MIINVVEIINIIPKMASEFGEGFDGKALINLGTYMTLVLFRLSAIPIATTNAQNLVKANQRLRLFENSTISKKVRK